MKRFVKIILLVLVTAILFPAPKAEAIDPVTIAILAPIALKVADKAKPYLIRALLNTGRCLLKMGKDTFQILYLPYGLLKMTVGAPFGGFRSGFIYTIKGAIAPGKLVIHTLLLPAMMIGLDINI